MYTCTRLLLRPEAQLMSPLVFYEEGVKVNSGMDLKMLDEDVLPGVTETLGDSYMFTKDGAPPHASYVILAWCRVHFNILNL